MSTQDLPHRAQVVFEQAYQLTDDQREVYLETACASDETLRQRVSQLLAAYDASEGFLPDPEVPRSECRFTSIEDGSYVGGYRVIRKIGEGGCGQVYLVEETDTLDRKAALKLVKPGMDSVEVLRRFEAERRSMALMNHPNIASVYDAGATEEGRPYFAIEFVDGPTITDYCDSRQLELRERLLLFMDVCGAVAHAHHKGIIHRDLKPSNVLIATIDERAVPKVIDFGIAKATSSESDDLRLTSVFQLVGTPAYMSPEQAASQRDIDARTDIYSLGVLLYELLAGMTPHEREGQSAADIRQCVQYKDIVAPSQRLARRSSDPAAPRSSAACSRKWSHRIAGELDWICLQALHRDRSKRYQSAGELADDVQRYLTNRPVEAHPAKRSYHFRKFLIANWFSCVTTLIVFVALLAALAVSWRSAKVAQASREAERQKRHEAEQITSFLLEAFRSPSPYHDGPDVRLADVLDRAVQLIEDGTIEDVGVKRRLLMSLADTYCDLGMAERYLQLCMVCDANDQLRTKDSRVRLADAYRVHGDFEKAIEILEREIPTLLETRGSNHNTTRTARLGYVNCLNAVGRADEALSVAEELVATAPRGSADWVTALIQSSKAHQSLGDYPVAIDLLQRALAHADGAEKLSQLQRINCMVTLGDLLRTTHRYDEAVEALEKAVDDAAQEWGREHPQTLTATSMLALAHVARGDSETGLELIEPAHRVAETNLGPQHPQRLQVSRNLGLILLGLHRDQEAAELFSQLLPMHEEKYGLAHPKTMIVRNNLVGCHSELGHYDEAIALMETNYEIAHATYGPGDLNTLRSSANIAFLLSRFGKHQEAIDRALACYRVAQNELAGTDVVWFQFALVNAYVDAKRHVDAIEMMETIQPSDAGGLYVQLIPRYVEMVLEAADVELDAAGVAASASGASRLIEQVAELAPSNEWEGLLNEAERQLKLAQQQSDKSVPRATTGERVEG